MISDEQKQIVFAEHEAFLERCVQQGIGRIEAQWALIHRSLTASAKTEAEAQARRPGYAELEAAYQQKHLRQSDPPAWKQLCWAWLKAAAKAERGDVILADGWKRPREILIKDVDLDWDFDKPIGEAAVSLSGPCYHPGKSFKADGHSLTWANYWIRKTEMSAAMQRNCRLAGVLSC